MPVKLDVKRKLLARSDRVKCVDLHPEEPWMICSLYNGIIHVWNYETQNMVKTFETAGQPVRAVKFVARKNWALSGSDDFIIRVFNYNTLERSHQFEAHSDYIRSIAVHPTQPFVLTSSDDMLIKLWNWDKSWACQQVFESHTHYVMQVVFNPKDNNTFASASLDCTVKVWQLGSSQPNFTLDEHEKGVNCVDYYHGGDKPYLISGGDDRFVKIWDYQNKTCVHTLDGHAQNISAVCFHPELPVILSGSEDGTVKIWHANTYRLENTLNYGLERVWTIQAMSGSNNVAIGYDEGSILIKVGREEPAISMDSSGKIIWAKHSEVQQANLNAIGDTEIKDGEPLPLQVKDMGSCEIYPQTISHNPNGRFVVVCGDGEYIIYTAMALRNKSFGSAQEFVWAQDSSEYAVRESSRSVKIFKNFKEKKTFKPDDGAEGIFGGFMLGVKSNAGFALYDWENLDLIRRIDIQPKLVSWSENGSMVAICTEESFFVLKYNPEAVAQVDPSTVGDEGYEQAFDVLGEVNECVKTGIWVGDCFIYTNSVNRLNYYVGGEIVTIAHLYRTMYVLGYLPKESKLYLGDKELKVVSYSLLLPVLEYQTAVMRRDFETADRVLPTIPKEQRTRVAHFLEKQGFRKQALAVSTDPEHRFDLALQLDDLQTALQLAQEAPAESKWKQLADLALAQSNFALALECLKNAEDHEGLLLLASSSGDAATLRELAEMTFAKKKFNITFTCYFLLGDIEKALDLLEKTDRLPEAALFAKAYAPSQVPRITQKWKEVVGATNKKAAQAIADPIKYDNLFPEFEESLQAEQLLKREMVGRRRAPAKTYPQMKPNVERSLIEEFRASGDHFEVPDLTVPPPEAKVERKVSVDSERVTMSARIPETVPVVVPEPVVKEKPVVIEKPAAPVEPQAPEPNEMDLLEQEIAQEMDKLGCEDDEDMFDFDGEDVDDDDLL